MITRIYKLDKFEPHHKESCDNYQNHYIDSVYYDGDYYYVFEQPRGTIDDTKLSVYVALQKSDFNTNNDYIGTSRDGAVEVRWDLPRADYNVLLEDDDKMENYCKSLIVLIKEYVKRDIETLNEIKQTILKKFNRLYGLGENLDRELDKLSKWLTWDKKRKMRISK